MAKPFFKKSVVICEISEMVITEIKYSQTTQIVIEWTASHHFAHNHRGLFA